MEAPSAPPGSMAIRSRSQYRGPAPGPGPGPVHPHHGVTSMERVLDCRLSASGPLGLVGGPPNYMVVVRGSVGGRWHQPGCPRGSLRERPSSREVPPGGTPGEQVGHTGRYLVVPTTVHTHLHTGGTGWWPTRARLDSASHAPHRGRQGRSTQHASGLRTPTRNRCMAGHGGVSDKRISTSPQVPPFPCAVWREAPPPTHIKNSPAPKTTKCSTTSTPTIRSSKEHHQYDL